MNRLEVISAVNQSRVARIPIPGVTRVELPADDTTVWAGTALNEIVAVDTSVLQVKNRCRPATATLVDMNTMTVVPPAVPAGPRS
jgi:hypothetical protein